MPQTTTSIPQWQTDYIKNLQDRASVLGKEKYNRFNQLSPEEKKTLKIKNKHFRNLQRGTESSFIPFYVKGNSNPVNLTFQELKKISEDEDFAKNLFIETTGISRVSPSEIDDLQERAQSIVGNKDILGEFIKRKENQYREEYEKNQHNIHNIFPYLKYHHPELKGVRYDPDIPKTEYGKTYQVRPQSRIAQDLKEAQEYNKKNYLLPYFEPHYKGIKEVIYDPNISEIKRDGNSLIRPQSRIAQDLKEAQEYNFKKLNYLEGLKDIGSELQNSRNVNPEDLFKRASAERELNNFVKKYGTIAPMNEIHEQAQRMIEEGLDEDSLDLARDELLSAKKSSLKAIDPYIKKATENPFDENEYIDKYMNQYQKNVIKSLKDETQENLLENIIPKINTSFAQHGAYHSGARMEAIRKAAQAKEKSLHREIAHLLHGSHKSGMENYQTEKNRALQTADVVKGALKHDTESAQARAAQLQSQGIAKHSMTHGNVSALGQMAGAKQQQEQNEINVRKAEFENERNHDWTQLIKENSLLKGLPLAGSNVTTSGQPREIYAPTPPNPYNVAGGAMSTLYNMLPQNKAKGGHVKRYAEGGSIQDDAMSRLKGLLQEQEAADIQRLKKSQIDPFQNWISHVGQQMMNNLSEDPLVNLGKGSANALQSMELSKERMANLYDKINESRMNQYKVLSEFENKKADKAYNDRYLKHQENALESMNKRHATSLEAMNQHRERSLAQQEKLYKMRLSSQEDKTQKMSATDRKMVEEAKRGLRSSLRMKKELGHLGGLLEQTTTGPVVGNFKKYLPSTKIDNQIRVGTNKLILDMHQGMKNIPRSEEFLKRIDSTKFDIGHHPEANKEAFDLMMSGADDIEQNSISTLLANGWTPEKIEKVFKTKVPENLYDEGLEGEWPEETEEPEGNPEENHLSPFSRVPTESLLEEYQQLSAGQ